jgi:hypothetical protein
MPEIRVDVYRELPVASGAVYRCLADFERAQPLLLAGTVRDYEATPGDVGDGAIVSCAMDIRGRERLFSFRISEPIAYKTITAYDHDSRLSVTWHLRPAGPVTEVEIEAYWSEPDSALDFLVTWWAYVAVRRRLNRILDRIPLVIADLGYDAAMPETSR